MYMFYLLGRVYPFDNDDSTDPEDITLTILGDQENLTYIRQDDGVLLIRTNVVYPENTPVRSYNLYYLFLN